VAYMVVQAGVALAAIEQVQELLAAAVLLKAH
jgi:hypothetical protein